MNADHPVLKAEIPEVESKNNERPGDSRFLNGIRFDGRRCEEEEGGNKGEGES
jgi:hypothetical protein